jgi:hypothetical protein
LDINSPVISDLILEIEKVRRRKIANHSASDNIKYLDPFENLKKITIPNNHLIVGRRGSGKTTLLLSTMKDSKGNLFLPLDSQIYRDWSSEKIILEILSRLVVKMKSSTEDSKKFIDEKRIYEVHNSKLFNRIKRILKKSETITPYEEFLSLIGTLKHLEFYVEKLKNLPLEPVKINIKNSFESINNLKICSKEEIKASGKVKAKGKFSNGFMSLESSLEMLANTKASKSAEKSSTNNETANLEYEKLISRSDLVEKLIITFSELFSQFYQMTGLKIVVYLDDFYLVNLEEQPKVIQYFHDIYKNTSNDAFCFKICSIPNRTRLNLPGKADFALKDDFSPIRLDKELYDFGNLKDFLLRITANLNPDLNISVQDISSLFNNGEVLDYATVATGGVPRDFLVTLAELLKIARSDNSNTIKKSHVYSAISDFKLDKEQNIEIECDIPPEKLREALEMIQVRVIDGLKTNVILYPHKLVKEHEELLRNLVNLRYLHIINENTSSENRKKEIFVSYLVDMTFYATGKRLKQGFDFRHFWEQDADHRHKHLRSAPIWSFEAEFISQFIKT